MANPKNITEGEEVKKSNSDISELTKSVSTLLQVIQQEKIERNDQIKEVLDTVQSLGNRIDVLQNEIEDVSDKGRLDEWEKKTTGKEPKKKVVNLQTYKGKIVIGWSDMITNDVTKDKDNKKIIEDQSTTLYYSDGTEEIVSYALWQTKRMPLPCILEATREDLETEQTILTLVDKAGNKYEINVKFVN